MPEEQKRLLDDLQLKFKELEGLFFDHQHLGPARDQTKEITATGTGTGIRYILYRALSPNTSVSVLTDIAGDLEIPINGTIVGIGAFVDTAGVTGSMIVDVNLNGTTLMNTNKITIETGEKTSRSATTQPALTTTAVVTGDLVTIDVDTIQTTPAAGLTVWLAIQE